MPKDNHPLSQQDLDEVNVYIHERLKILQAKHDMPTKRLAEILGYDKGALHRIISKQTPLKINCLLRLNHYFGLDLSSWFPPLGPKQMIETLPVSMKVLCQDEAPLTKEIISEVRKLSALGKKDLLDLLRSNPERLAMLLSVNKRLDAENEKKLKDTQGKTG